MKIQKDFLQNPYLFANFGKVTAALQTALYKFETHESVSNQLSKKFKTTFELSYGLRFSLP